VTRGVSLGPGSLASVVASCSLPRRHTHTQTHTHTLAQTLSHTYTHTTVQVHPQAAMLAAKAWLPQQGGSKAPAQASSCEDTVNFEQTIDTSAAEAFVQMREAVGDGFGQQAACRV